MKTKLKGIFITIIASLFLINLAQYSNADNRVDAEYKIDETKGIISRIVPTTTLEIFKTKTEVEKIYRDENLSQAVTTGFVGSGMWVQKDGKKYKLNIIGDFDGDGQATQVELSKMIKNIVGIKEEPLTADEQISADFTGDGEVDQVDITRFIRYVVYGELKIEADFNIVEVKIEPTGWTNEKIKISKVAVNDPTVPA